MCSFCQRLQLGTTRYNELQNRSALVECLEDAIKNPAIAICLRDRERVSSEFCAEKFT